MSVFSCDAEAFTVHIPPVRKKQYPSAIKNDCKSNKLDASTDPSAWMLLNASEIME